MGTTNQTQQSTFSLLYIHLRNGLANKPLDHSDPPRKLQSCISPYSFPTKKNSSRKKNALENLICHGRPMFVFGGDVITCARYRPSWGSVLSVSVHAVLHKLRICNSPSCTSSSSAKDAKNVFFFSQLRGISKESGGMAEPRD